MRFLKIFPIFLIIFIFSAGAFVRQIKAQTAEKPDLRQDIQRAATAASSNEKKISRPEVKEHVHPAELITPTSYSFTAAGAALEDMSTGSMTLIGAGTDDSNSALADIGFNFYFDGAAFTRYGVNGNGFIRLGSSPIGNSFTNSIGTVANSPKIMPFWDDLCVGTNGKVHAKTVGSAPGRKLIVEFRDMQVTRGGGCMGPGNGTFQLWLFETSGMIQFVYGTLPAATANGGYSIGLQSGAAFNLASVTTSGGTVSYGASNNTQTNAIAAGTSYIFTPSVPAAPTGTGVTAITATSMVPTWIDNASNEIGYQILRSTDNVNFQQVATLPANSTSYADGGLTPDTQYFWYLSLDCR